MPSPVDDAGARLSTREVQVLELLAGGRTDKEVADSLGLNIGTVRVYRKRAEWKLGTKGLVQSLLVAWRLGQVDLERLGDEAVGARTTRP